MRSRLIGATRDTFASLRVRNFRLFFSGQLISQVGNWLTMVALTLLVLHRTGSGIAIGLLTFCQFAPLLFMGAWAGLVADRSDKRRLLLITQSLQMAQSVTLAVLAFAHQAPLAAFYVTAFAGGVLLAFDNPARRAFVSEMVHDELVPNAVTLNSALMTSSRVIGPALAGVLVVTTGFGWCFTIDAISYLAVLAGLWLMRTGELRPVPLTPRGKGQVREGLRYVRGVPELWVPLVMMAIIGTFTFNFSVVMPLFAEHTLHGSDRTYTLLLSVMSAGSLVGALAAARRKVIEVRLLAMAAIAYGVAVLALASAPSITAAFPICLVVGMASITFLTSTSAIMQVRAEPRMRGRVLALQAIVFIGSTPVGGPLLGWACDTFGPRIGFVLGGVAALAAGAWGFAATRRARAVDEVGGVEAPIDELAIA